MLTRVLHTVCRPITAAASAQPYVTVRSIYSWENRFNCSEELCRHYTAYPDREYSRCATLWLITRRCAQRYWRSKSQAACLAFSAAPTAFAIRTEYFPSRWLSSRCARVSASACTWPLILEIEAARSFETSASSEFLRCAIPTVRMSLCPSTHQTKRYTQT